MIIIKSGETALHAAAFKGHDKVVGVLLERGADINLKDNVRLLIVCDIEGQLKLT